MTTALKFCEFCDSRGVRHKKDCTRPAPAIRIATLKPDLQQQVVEIIKQVIVEKEVVREVEKPQLTDFDLYKALKDSGYIKGGMGQVMQSPLTDESVYLPLPSELYNQFAQDPSGWDIVRDHLARAWLELQRK